MERTIEFGGDCEQDVTVTTSGTATVEGLRAMVDAIVSHPRFRPGMSLLIDHSALDVSGLTASDMETVGRSIAQLGDRFAPSIRAVVAASPATFGLTRMSQVYSGEPGLLTDVFHTRAEAEAWLAANRR